MKDYLALYEALRAWRALCATRYGAGWRQRKLHYDIVCEYSSDHYHREWAHLIGCPELAPSVS